MPAAAVRHTLLPIAIVNAGCQVRPNSDVSRFTHHILRVRRGTMARASAYIQTAHDVPHADAVLEMLGMADASGATCALLTPAIKSRLRELAGGQVLEVRVDDPSASEDIAAWCRLTGHQLLAMVDEMPKYTRYFLRKKRG
jgi:tRNA 2-thiouridine synthesizing protein A